jgi:hypothetical protein
VLHRTPLDDSGEGMAHALARRSARTDPVSGDSASAPPSRLSLVTARCSPKRREPGRPRQTQHAVVGNDGEATRELDPWH